MTHLTDTKNLFKTSLNQQTFVNLNFEGRGILGRF